MQSQLSFLPVLFRGRRFKVSFSFVRFSGCCTENVEETNSTTDDEEVIVSNETPVQITEPRDVITPATDNNPEHVSKENVTVSTEVNANKTKSEAPVQSSEDTKTSATKQLSKQDEKKSAPASSASPEKESPTEAAAKKLYISLKRDMTKEQETIINAVTELITPMGKAIDSIQAEVSKSRDIAVENSALKARIEKLQQQLSDQKLRIQEAEQDLRLIKSEKNDLISQLSALENKNAELDSKLSEAYSINSRESSLEAEKIRSELKKAFTFLYNDWLDYEFSDVSEDNYESLQAIIKKTFRSLERSGIDFKGKSE